MSERRHSLKFGAVAESPVALDALSKLCPAIEETDGIKYFGMLPSHLCHARYCGTVDVASCKNRHFIRVSSTPSVN